MRTLCVFLLVLLIAAPAGAEARTILVGISDTGEARDFNRESHRLGFRFPSVQTFHPWGNSLNQASWRWRQLGVKPLLHISTADDETGRELITPRQIARGRGDFYLLELNRSFHELGLPARVRPMAEPNRPLNVYSAFRPDGSRRGGAHSPAFYRKAFRRIYLILHGGRVKRINRILRASNMPPISRAVKKFLPTPDLKVMWSPLPSSLGIRGNSPRAYWPGRRFYDITGTSFFSAWPDWGRLNSFYQRFSFRKPFSIGEWGLNFDAPGFTWRLFRWCMSRRSCESLYYYRGFNSDGYELRNFPRSSDVLADILRHRVFAKKKPDQPSKKKTAQTGRLSPRAE